MLRLYLPAGNDICLWLSSMLGNTQKLFKILSKVKSNIIKQGRENTEFWLYQFKTISI